MKTNPTTEKSVYNGAKLVTVNAEIPEHIYEQMNSQHKIEIINGTTSLTFEQYIGGFIGVGFNWSIYKQLKQIFEKSEGE